MAQLVSTGEVFQDVTPSLSGVLVLERRMCVVCSIQTSR